MANNVFANGREVACKAAAGKSVAAFPDVCFTPPQTPATPPGVPVPYPNTAFAKDTAKGSKTVKISGKEVMLQNQSYFKTSTGDEAGCAPKKGVVTGKIKGKAYFTSWSPNVKIEGKCVVRHLDMTTHNHGSMPGNTAPWPYLDTMSDSGGGETDPCKKDKQKEKQSCADYMPYKEDGKDVCKEAGLDESVQQQGPEAKDWADDKATKAKANECIKARRCRLVQYNAKKDGINGCCPSQTPDHAVPKSSFYKNSYDDGERLDNWDGYKMGAAPCVCAEGGSNTHGSHGLRHASHKANGPGAGVIHSFDEELTLCLDSVQTVFKSSNCDRACLEAQLRDGHARMGEGDVKHSPSGSKMTNKEIAAARRAYSPQKVRR